MRDGIYTAFGRKALPAEKEATKASRVAHALLRLPMLLGSTLCLLCMMAGMTLKGSIDREVT